jgi:hypothetical protein
MRTKTLLIVAAALAAGIVSSQAQVYSQNVVGYANIPTPTGNANYLLTCPFVIGVSNGANEIWPVPNTSNGLPDGSLLSIWDGTEYVTYESDSGSSSLWDDNNGNPITYSPVLPVGIGFFLSPASPITNLFSGTVGVNVGTSNVTVLATGNANYLLGCVVPYSGAVTNGNVATGVGGPCLFSPDGGNTGIPDGSLLSLWNGTAYDTYESDSGSPSYWDDNNGNPILVPPSISVGQGFFLSPASPYNWTVGL